MRSKIERLARWYLNLCIRKGRIVAGIPEAAFSAEVLERVDKIHFLLTVGTPEVLQHPTIKVSVLCAGHAVHTRMR